jgi:nucleoside-diphosphate-sugar epimerase
MRRVLILGYGRLGQAFCRLYRSKYEIRGVKRTRLAPSSDLPCEVVLLPIQSESLAPHLEWAEVVIFCPSSGRDGQSDFAHYRTTYLENLECVLALIARCPSSPRQVILIGSTGVYPQSQGGAWSEERPIPVESPRQEVLLLTERALIRSGAPFVILRCGGLYGEGRENFSWLRQKKELRSSELTAQPLALVHHDDVCGVLDRVIERRIVGEIYNVRDDSTFSRKALYRSIAGSAGIPVIDDGPSPVAVDRQIPNTKVKELLGYMFRRPPVTAYLPGGKR